MQFLIYKEREDYIGVCLNFGIEEYGKDPLKLRESIFEASCSYLDAVNKKGLSNEYLNLVPEKKHLDKIKEMEWSEELNQRRNRHKKSSPSQEPTYFSFTKQPYDQGLACFA